MRTSLVKSSSVPGIKLARYIRPLWPIPSLTPDSRCPHGRIIRRDRICIICDKAAKSTQNKIDALPAPPPENPEDRALKQIAFHREYLASHPELPIRMRFYIMRQIDELERILREYVPTKYYRPPGHYKGGIG